MVKGFWLRAVAVLLVLLIALILLFTQGLWKTQQGAQQSLSRFIASKAANEWVLAKLETQELFSQHQFNRPLQKLAALPLVGELAQLPIGDTKVQLSVHAYYAYYIKPNEISVKLVEDELHLSVARLYLQQPVAYRSDQLTSWSREVGFGPDALAMEQDLKHGISEQLVLSGTQAISMMEHKAAHSLADNVHHLLQGLAYAGFYRRIVVSFTDSAAGGSSDVRMQFEYPQSFCSPMPCRLELPLAKGVWILP